MGRNGAFIRPYELRLPPNANTRAIADLAATIAHEFGHAVGLDDLYTGACPTIMQQAGPNCVPVIKTVQMIDVDRSNQQWDSTQRQNCHSRELPTPTPTPTPITITYPLGGCYGAPDYSRYPSGCQSGFVVSGGVCTRSDSFINQCERFGGYDAEACSCTGGCSDGGACSPIVIDTAGNGFEMTDAPNGVSFDVQGWGTPEQIGWTTARGDDGWLALDRDGNGQIDNGMELFGTATPQLGPERNGFLALAQYDRPAKGGNGDGVIDSRDAIFPSLRIWIDSNHNGASEPAELHTLASLGITALELNYKESKRTDEYGNQFKYRAKVKGSDDANLGRWAWDVIPVHAQ